MIHQVAQVLRIAHGTCIAITVSLGKYVATTNQDLVTQVSEAACTNLDQPYVIRIVTFDLFRAASNLCQTQCSLRGNYFQHLEGLRVGRMFRRIGGVKFPLNARSRRALREADGIGLCF